MSQASPAAPFPLGLDVMARPFRLGLLGSPNSGKTTLFNALTGLRAKVGNYPGVTVERREGEALVEGRRVVVIDLPGTYSLEPISPDEAVVTGVLDGSVPGVPPPDALVVTADACSLGRSLLFIGQVLRLGLPTCLVVTMVDELRARGGRVDLERLSAALGVPVVGVVGHRGLGLDELRRLLGQPERWSRPVVPPPAEVEARAGWADSVVARAVEVAPAPDRLTARIDAVVLHPVAGTLLFATVMVIFFQLIFSSAEPAMDAIDAAIVATQGWLHAALPPGLAADFLTDGLLAGVGSVVVFLPQILILFGVLYLLEDIGYMARAAFVVDRAMGRIGLEGRAFVALLSSYACAVPGIMATRTIPSPRDRLVTILVAPLMTCSARLPVYALLIGAFVPARAVLGPIRLQGLVLLGLYLLGALAAVAVAALLKRTLVRGEGLPFYLELPPYRIPPLRLWLHQVWGAARAFLRRAGTIILAVSIVLWGLLTFPRSEPAPGLSRAEAARAAVEQSAAGRLGHAIEPLIAPLGFDWKIGVGLVASLAAREVIVATLAQIYATSDEDSGSLRDAIRADRGPAHRGARLHAGQRRLAARLLRVRAPVHVDPRRDAPRDQLVALAGVRLRLPAGARLGRELRDGAPRRLALGVGARAAPSASLRAVMPGTSLRAGTVAATLACLVLAGACGPRYARVESFDEPGLRVVLRSETRGGETVARGFDHPATIASVRLAHILARLDVRMGSEGGGERVPALSTVLLYTVSDQLSRALAKATPDQEVVVQAIRKEKNLVIFDQKLLTSFVAYVKGDDLVLHLAYVDWTVPKEGGGQGSLEDAIPEPFPGRQVQDFRVVATEGFAPAGAQAVSVDWRNPIFREPTNVRVGADGRLLRRSVLMESPAAEEPEPAGLPADAPPETLRALADLQEQRTRGEISETRYHALRRDLLRQADDLHRSQGAAPSP